MTDPTSNGSNPRKDGSDNNGYVTKAPIVDGIVHADEIDEDAAIAAGGNAITRRTQGGQGIGAPAEKSKDFKATLRRLWQMLTGERLRMISVFLLAAGSVVFVSIAPRLLGQATDIVFTGATGDGGIDFGALHSKLIMIVVLYVAAAGLTYAQAFILAGIVQRSMSDLREKVENKIHSLPLSYIDKHSRGDLLSRVTNDIDNLAQSLQQVVSQTIVSIMTMIGVGIMMYVVSPMLATIALLVIPPSVFAIKFLGGRARPRFLEQWAHTGQLNSQVEEVFTGHDVVKAYGRQNDVEAAFRAENDKLYEASSRAQFTSSLIGPAMLFLGNVQYLLIAVVGGLRITSGAISLGDMQAMIQYSRRFSQPLTQLASMATVFQSGIASLERVLEVVDAEDVSSDPTDELLGDTPVAGRVAFEDVSFSYLPDEPLIEGLSVVAEPGQTVAIVGPTGAGKTTLVNLIMRFYDLDGGRITLDGRDTATYPREELRAKVGMVLQDTWLFGGTIWENLQYGNPDATDEQIREAARVTYVDRFVHSLPDGYQTVINDDGDNVSAGEKQLLTIARAFLADPSILILDEATSSVDTRTEVLIQEAMKALRADRTSFVIAHRLSTIRGADTILVMDSGKIVEQGSHDELIKADGFYAALYNSQFSGAATEVL